MSNTSGERMMPFLFVARLFTKLDEVVLLIMEESLSMCSRDLELHVGWQKTFLVRY